MRVIRAAEHVVVPWKNGGGTATAIVGQPEEAGFDAFDWRLSGARVARHGPFSIFPHVDRTMLILRGPGIAIDGLPGGVVTLTAASPPFHFPGDVPVVASVPDGPIDNLNLMVDRRRFASAARRIEVGAAALLALRGVGLVYCEAGEIRVGAALLAKHETLAKDDTLVCEGEVVLEGEGRAIAMEICPVAA